MPSVSADSRSLSCILSKAGTPPKGPVHSASRGLSDIVAFSWVLVSESTVSSPAGLQAGASERARAVKLVAMQSRTRI